jgi:hypothetical protein
VTDIIQVMLARRHGSPPAFQIRRSDDEISITVANRKAPTYGITRSDDVLQVNSLPVLGDDPGFTIHRFVTSANFIVNQYRMIRGAELFLVGGGGGGGGAGGGGGGAGRPLYFSGLTFIGKHVYAVGIGPGGPGGNMGYGSSGGASLFGIVPPRSPRDEIDWPFTTRSVIAGGGGGGGYLFQLPGNSAAGGGLPAPGPLEEDVDFYTGSGGGGAFVDPRAENDPYRSGGSGFTLGGWGWVEAWQGKHAGGGGGGGGNGESQSKDADTGGAGGIGVICNIDRIDEAAPDHYWAGGGYGVDVNVWNPGVHMNPGGGGGAGTSSGEGQPGGANMGAGGGGGGGTDLGGSGGDGIVIIRYPGRQKASGGSVTEVGVST